MPDKVVKELMRIEFLVVVLPIKKSTAWWAGMVVRAGWESGCENLSA